MFSRAEPCQEAGLVLGLKMAGLRFNLIPSASEDILAPPPLNFTLQDHQWAGPEGEFLTSPTLLPNRNIELGLTPGF